MTQPVVAEVLDCRGLLCPMPVVKLSKAIKKLDMGSVIEMLATDPGSVADLEAFERQTGHQVVGRSEADGVYHFLVRRSK
jgi:tRNA 2-thiouridine synthesizing protein A